MKKILLSILSLSLILFPMTQVQASEVCTTEEETCYYEEEIVINETSAAVSTASTTSVNTVTASKRTSYTSSNGSVLWYVEVTATFTYNGVTAKCTSSYVTAVSQNANWKIASKSSSKSANQAKATASAKQYSNGEAVLRLTKSVTLTCTASGQLI